MKYLLVLLALIPLALGRDIQEAVEAKERSISSQIVDAIEAAKLQMPCGFPGLGVPPLAPLKIAHKEVNIDGDSIKAYGEFDNFRLDGLNDFDIVEFKVSALLSRVTFNFNWNHAYLNTDYVMSTSLDNFGVVRQGNAKFALKDLNVRGTIKYSLGVISGNLRLKEINLFVSLGEVKSEIGGLSKYPIVNRKLNEVIEEWIMLAINDNTDNFSYLTNGYLVPMANDMIGDMGLSDLLGLIGGSGGASEGGNEGEDQEPKVCIPPEDN